MWPELINIGGLKVTWWGIYLISALVISSFSIWRKMRSDFTSDEIFGFTLNLVFGLTVGCLIGSVIETGRLPGLSAWGIVIGGWWALRRWCTMNKWDFWELFDWSALFGLWLWFWGSIFYGFGARFALAGSFAAIMVTWIVRKNYRKFRWYPSGKDGIVGLFSVLAFAVYEIVAAIINPVRVYWWGLTLSQTIAAWVIAICLVIMYLRGGNEFHLNVKMSKRKT